MRSLQGVWHRIYYLWCLPKKCPNWSWVIPCSNVRQILLLIFCKYLKRWLEFIYHLVLSILKIIQKKSSNFLFPKLKRYAIRIQARYYFCWNRILQHDNRGFSNNCQQSWQIHNKLTRKICKHFGYFICIKSNVFLDKSFSLLRKLTTPRVSKNRFQRLQRL